MYFDATSANMTKLLVVALAIVAIVMLMRGRYASNMPLLFCVIALIRALSAGDRPTDSLILFVGLAFALILRFEFMGKGFTKFIALATGAAIGLEVLSYLDQVFANGTMFS